MVQDCDRDEDCRLGLLCWQRSGLDNNVPGCQGSAIENVDYCYDPYSAMSENIATIPASSLAAAPSNIPTTQHPTQEPTQAPTQTNEDKIWNAFMDMVSKYANAKKDWLEEDYRSPEPSPEPTTAFHAAWMEGMERWKKSGRTGRTVQNDVANIP
jgi:hypothetical protein